MNLACRHIRGIPGGESDLAGVARRQYSPGESPGEDYGAHSGGAVACACTPRAGLALTTGLPDQGLLVILVRVGGSVRPCGRITVVVRNGYVDKA